MTESNVVSVVWETTTGEVTLTLADATNLSARIDPAPADPPVRVEMDLREERLTLVFDGAHRVAASMVDESTARALVRERPVVYLDQCHWSAMAGHLRGERDGSDVEQVVAARLAAWASNGDMILPVSSGHLLETGPLFGAKRLEIVLTMLTLCGGWFISHPLQIRHRELCASMTGSVPSPEDVVGLTPGVLLPELATTGLPDFPPAFARMYSRSLEVLSVYAMLVDDSPTPENRLGDEATRSWAEGNQEAASAARRNELSREQVRKLATQRLLYDHRAE